MSEPKKASDELKGVEEIELDEDEEAALDAAWAKMDGKGSDAQPERNAAADPTHDPAPVVHAYPSGKTTTIGTAAEVRRFFAWARTQDHYPDLQQFAIDSSTDPTAEDGAAVQEFARQLAEAVQAVDETQGVGAALHATAAAILEAAADGVEGLVVSESEPSEEEDEP